MKKKFTEKELLRRIQELEAEVEGCRAKDPARHEKDRTQLFLDTVETIIVALDAEGKITAINRKGCRLFGYEEDELIGQFWFSKCLPQPDGMEIVYPVFKRLMADEIEPLEYFENPIARRNGELRQIAWHNALLHDEQGRIIGTLSSGEDITERKRIEQALGVSETRLEEFNQILAGILDHTHMMAVFLNPRFDFVWVNRAYADTCGYEPSFFPGKNHFDLYPDAENQAIFQRVVDTGEPFFVTAKPFMFPDQPERGVTYWDWSLIPVKDDGGKANGLVFTLAEVTERVRFGQSIRESEERHRAIIQTAMDGFWITDVQGRLLDVNETYCRMSGYSREELLTMRVSDLDAIETSDDMITAHAQKIREHGEERFESRHRRKDGTLFIVEVSLQYQAMEGGRVVAFIRDISERKDKDELLQTTSRQLSLAIDSSNAGIWEWDIVTGDIEWSPRMFDLVGVDPRKAEASFEAWRSVLHPEDREAAEERIEAALAQQKTLNSDYRLVLPDGRIRWINAMGRCLHDSQGRPVKMIGLCQDITGRKRAEERIANERENFLKIFAAAPVGLLLLDSDTVIQYANKTAADMVLRDQSALIGKRGGGGLGCVHSTENPKGCGFGSACAECPLRNGLESVLAGGKNIHGAEINVSLIINGKLQERWLKVSVEPIGIDNQPFVIVAIDDITERKRAEEQIHRNDARLKSIVNILQYHAETTQEFLDYALDEAIGLTESKLGYIYFYHEDRKEFVLNSWSKDVMRECTIVNPRTCYALDKTGVWGEAVRQRKPIVLNDFQTGHPLKKGYPEGHAHLVRFMTVPVFREDRVVAVVGVANKADDYDETDVLQLTLLMDAVWRSLDIKKGEETLRESESLNAAIASLSAALLAAESIDTIADLVLHYGKQLTRSRHGFVGHIDQASGHLISTTLSHDIWNECRVTDKTYVFEHFKGLWGWVLYNRTPLMTNTPSRDSRSTGIPAGHMPIERFLSVPVMLEERLMGQIALANADRDYTDKDIQTLHRLADVYSLALQRLETEQALQRSHDLLEERVADRTAELERANQSLKAEIKKRKLLEAEAIHKSRLASVGELAAGVAHEINNPINVIINYAQILSDDSPDPQNPQAIPQRIMKEADRVAAIVRNLLNFARESDDVLGPCNIAEIVGDSLELMRKQLDKDSIRLSMTMPEAAQPVMVNFHKMQQVFVNLIGNARHALNAKFQGLTSDKCIEIETRIVEFEGRPWMRTTLTDNGIGIPRKNLDRLFEPFFSTKPKGEGTGLGLSISYGIVRENGGRIDIESEEGLYTRVIVDLPLAAV